MKVFSVNFLPSSPAKVPRGVRVEDPRDRSLVAFTSVFVFKVVVFDADLVEGAFGGLLCDAVVGNDDRTSHL